MPLANRDKESLYPPGKLSLWFLATSGVLVVSVFWMLADDFIRPWKGVQRAFFQKQAALLAVKRDVEESRLDDAEKPERAELHRLNLAIAAAGRALEEKSVKAQVDDLKAKIAEQKLREENDTRQIKALKGSYAATNNAMETARAGHDDRLAAELLEKATAIASEQDVLDRDKIAQIVARDEFGRQLETILAPKKALEKERDTLLGELAKVTTALDDARAKTQSNQWRNLPMADIIAPSIKIEKVVLDNIHDDMVFATSPKVDMCMTCHRGIDVALVSEREDAPEAGIGHLLEGFLRFKFGEKAWDKLRDDPRLAKATAPGHVRAWLTGSKAKLDDVFDAKTLRAALGDENYAKVVEGKDLLAAFRIEAVQWAHPHLDLIAGSTSKHKMESVGCTVCHAGVGRRLDFTRATHSPDSEDQAHEWAHEHDWQESGAEYVDFPMLPKRYVEGQCLKCHGTADPFLPQPETLVQWDAARSKKEGVPVRREAPKPVDGPPSAVDGRWHAATLARGIATVQEWGCTGCHMIKDFEKRPGFGDPKATSMDHGPDWSKPAPGSLTAYGNPKLGPDLTHVKDKTTLEWIERWIAVPNSYRIDTRMPSFYRWRAHDDQFTVVPGPDGKPQDVPLVVDPTTRDLAQSDVDVWALATFLYNVSETRASTYPDLPAGNVKDGAKTFYTMGCYGCHIGPGGWDLAKGQWADGLPDDGARFKIQGDELPPGPRLTAIGSKYKDPKMLAAWIDEPRHYNSVTRMPNVIQGRAEMGPDNKAVVRSALQIRADLAAYLMSYKDAAFDAQPLPESRWTSEHDRLLDDMWLEWYGKKDLADDTKTVTQEAAAAVMSQRDRNQKLFEVGKRLVGYRGCFGCHNIKGSENEQPIGKELSYEGLQDLHKFDFGIVPKAEIPRTRWDWIENKLANPRVYDKGKWKPRWNDKLRMPRFNFTSVDRESVVSVVLGLVKEPMKDPIKTGVLPKATPATDAIARGRAVIERYRCTQCHTLEGRRGVLTAEQAGRGLELWMLPPNLYGEGNRVRSEWLFQFLKNPYLHQPDGVRPAVIQRMPLFRLSDDEASAMVDYFDALAERKDRLATDPEDEPLDDTPYKEPVVITLKEKDAQGKDIESSLTVHNLREEAKALFDRAGCIKCHLPKGAPITDKGEGATAPPFGLAGVRLQRSWMFDLLHNPQNQIQGTKMPSFWPLKRARGKLVPTPDSMSVTYPQFLVGARAKAKPSNDEIADAQMAALVRYLRFHYEAPVPTSSSPPEPK